MTSATLKARVEKSLIHINHLAVYECSYIDFTSMATSPVVVEVAFDAVNTLGRFPAGDPAKRTAWRERQREMSAPAIAAAKAALRKARIKFREMDAAPGVEKLLIIGTPTKGPKS